MKHYIFAHSTLQGLFEELVIIPENQVIAMGMETEDGTYILEYVDEGKSEELYYIDVVIVEGENYNFPSP